MKIATAGYNLFPYQHDISREALNILYRRIDSEFRRCVIHMPTGAGKTRTAMSIVCRILSDSPQNSVVIWLAHTKELCEQALSEYCNSWAKIGTYDTKACQLSGDVEFDLASYSGFLVVGLSKMNSILKKNTTKVAELSDRVRLVVFDEAHMAIAPTYKFVTQFCCDTGAALLGLSATPGRTLDIGDDDIALAELFGYNLVQMETQGYKSPIDYLINEEYLAYPHFFHLDYKDEKDVRNVDDESYMENIGRNEIRNQSILRDLEFAMAKHQRVIVFCPSLYSVERVTELARMKGLRVKSIRGDMTKEDRKKTLDFYKGNSSEPTALINCEVLTTGFDAPKTSCVIIARTTKSLVLYSQMVGRALRGPKNGGNKTADIYTVVNSDDPAFSSPRKAFMNWNPLWSIKSDY